MGENIFLSIACILILSWAMRVLYWIWWRPMKLERCLREQGIKGPPYKLLYGNLKENSRLLKEAGSKPINLSHRIVQRVAPMVHQNVNNYGKMSVFWFGTYPRVNIMDPELIRDILSNKFGHVNKLKPNALTKLLATGVANYESEQWAKHRRIIRSAFHMEKLKCMLPAFDTCCHELVSRWEKLVMPKGSYELDVWPEILNLTGDVISRTVFGSSYEEGRQIFQLQREQATLVMEVFQSLYIPGFRYLPTKKNKRMKEIDREVRIMLRGIINKREKTIKEGKSNHDNLLGLLLESNFKNIQEHGNNKNIGMSIDEVIEECKLFYLAGQETTSAFLTWTMVALSMHPEWQVSARKEVLQVFGDNRPDFDGLNRLKTVTMILYEVLRLYPPSTMLYRCTYKEMKLGKISLPARVQLLLPIILIHHDREFWGEDAEEFKPERFAEGVSKAAKNQFCFFPFGLGPRICLGQNFAMIKVKMALAMILRRFSFELSPSYAHAPYTVITLRPQYGAQLILHKL